MTRDRRTQGTTAMIEWGARRAAAMAPRPAAGGCRRQPDRQWLNARGRELMDQRNE